MFIVHFLCAWCFTYIILLNPYSSSMSSTFYYTYFTEQGIEFQGANSYTHTTKCRVSSPTQVEPTPK